MEKFATQSTRVAAATAKCAKQQVSLANAVNVHAWPSKWFAKPWLHCKPVRPQ